MSFKEKVLNKTFMHNILVYFSISGLGLLVILAFYLFAKKDAFYLYDDFISVKINGTYKIDVKSNRDIKELNWYVENPEIATIDNKGNLTAHGLGETKIIVRSKYHLFEQSISLRVSNFTVYSIVFEDDKITIDPGSDKLLVPVLNGDSNIKSNLKWKSSDKSIATVSDTGRVEGIKSGNAIITATDRYTGLATSIEVKVSGAKEEDEETILAFAEDATDEIETETIPIESIALNTNHLDMYIAEQKKISATITPNNATDKTLVYRSSDNAIATVNNQGIIVAHKTGLCNIFVSSADGNVNVSMIVKVKGAKIKVQNIALPDNQLKLSINESYVLSPVITPHNASIQDVTYTSSNNDVVTIDENGKMKGLKKGTATILAISKDGRKTSSMMVEVTDSEVSKKKISELTFDNFKTTMVVGEKNKIDVQALDENKKEVKVNLTTSSKEVATIDQEGNIQALSPGIIFLELETTDGSYHETRNLTVLPDEIEAEFIYINKTSLQLVIGKTYNVYATVIPENANDKKIVWYSNNNAIATVNETGMITAKGAGTAIITAQVLDTGIRSTIRVAVVNKEQLIDVRKKKLTPYYTNFLVYDEGEKTGRAMQNFAIANKGTASEKMYVSFPTRSNVSKTSNLNSNNKKAIVRTVVLQIPKSEMYKPSSKKRTYMYLNNSGHGQSFDIDQNTSYIWSNGGGYISRDKNDVYWGNHRRVVKVKFKKNKIKSSYTATKSLSIRSNNVTFDNPEVSFDWDNNLVAVRSNQRVAIYKASDFSKGKLTQMYSFTIANKASDGTNYPRQGHDLYNGYYYQYRGYAGTKLYIEVYNYIGELQYTYIFNPKLAKQEAEGLKIYNNIIYIGITKNCGSGCTGKINNVYFFK